MSKRNTFELKEERRDERKHDAAVDRGRQRIPVSTVPPEVLVSILTNPKNKQSGKARRRLMRSRDVVLNVDRLQPKGADVYFARKAGEMTWERLNRQLLRNYRRRRRLALLLEKMAPGSKFRTPLDAEFTALNVIHQTITHEIDNRSKLTSPAH